MTGEKIPACHITNPKPHPFKPSHNKPLTQRSLNSMPIPKGSSLYALAKQAEYLTKDFEKAECLYKRAILENDRKESAIKDLASLLHQQGKTQQACALLEKFSRSIKTNPEKLQNLYRSFKRHLSISPNSLKKFVKIVGFSSSPLDAQVLGLFSNPSRIKKIEKSDFSVVLEFGSNSSSRKTFEGFSGWERFKVYWVDQDWEVVAEFSQPRRNFEVGFGGEFCFLVFSKDPMNPAFCLPLDEGLEVGEKSLEIDPKEVLGEGLARFLFPTQLTS